METFTYRNTYLAFPNEGVPGCISLSQVPCGSVEMGHWAEWYVGNHGI